jgi:hypothetical protein
VRFVDAPQITADNALLKELLRPKGQKESVMFFRLAERFVDPRRS